MLYIISGASGSGKTTIIPHLTKLLPQASIHDFDDIGVPSNADKTWRQQSTEKWLTRYLESNSSKPFVICGQTVLGEVLACPSAYQLKGISWILLDVHDIQRIERLKKRGTYGTDQHTLNWAAWLRIHTLDPSWQQHVIKENCWSELSFGNWDQLKSWPKKVTSNIIETSDNTPQEVAQKVAKLIASNTHHV